MRTLKMFFGRTPLLVGAAVIFFLTAATSDLRSQPAESVAVSELRQHTHIHGLAVERSDPSFLLIATHHGLYRAGPDGRAERISAVQDFMGFNPHPSDAAMLFASGHPAEGGNLGFIASEDGGRSWTQVSPGVNGPVDFHQMTVSPADPQVIYGAYGDIQVSRDGGTTWEIAGPAPGGLIDLAASSRSPDKLYAATEDGLLVSTDGARSWNAALDGAAVSLVEMTPDGALYAFVLGRGLLRSDETELDFIELNSGWGSRIPLHLAVDPADPDRLFLATQTGEVFASTDAGQNWTAVGR